MCRNFYISHFGNENLGPESGSKSRIRIQKPDPNPESGSVLTLKYWNRIRTNTDPKHWIEANKIRGVGAESFATHSKDDPEYKNTG